MLNHSGDKEEKKHLCPDGLLKGPAPLQAMVNPNKGEIYFDKLQLANHCAQHCTRLQDCEEKTKKGIISLFENIE